MHTYMCVSIFLYVRMGIANKQIPRVILHHYCTTCSISGISYVVSVVADPNKETVNLHNSLVIALSPRLGI